MEQGTENAKGIFFMLLAMAAFAGGDVLIKTTSAFLSPAQTMFILISSGLIIFAIIARLNGENLRDPRAFKPILLVRYAAEMLGLMAMVVSLNKVPLPIVAAVSQAAPILVAGGAVFFLNEVVSWRRWTSIAVGFIGVLFVIQPGDEGFDFAVIWPVLALIAFSIRDLVTRLTPQDMSSASIATFTMATALPFTTAWVLLNGELFIPSDFNWLLVACMIILGSGGYLFLVASLRVGELSSILPFRYSRIVFLLVLGLLIFDERPTFPMLLGSFLIITSGIYIIWRQKVVAERLE